MSKNSVVNVYKEYVDFLQKQNSKQQDFINKIIEFIQEAEKSDIGDKYLWFRKQAKKIIKQWEVGK